MTSRMVGSVLTLVILLFSVVDGAAQTYTQMQWGMNKGVTPYAFGANINGTWRNLGTVSAAGVWAIPSSNIGGLGTAATYNIGTSGANVPLLNGVNSWSGTQTFNGSLTVQGTANASASNLLSVTGVSSPYAFGATVGGSFRTLGTVTSAGAWDIPSSNVSVTWPSTSAYPLDKFLVGTLNVKQFGAKGDVNPLNSLAYIAGDTLVCDQVYTGFTSADVGKIFHAERAGASGVLLNTTIASYVSPSCVRLSVAPSISTPNTSTAYSSTSTNNVQAGSRTFTVSAGLPFVANQTVTAYCGTVASNTNRAWGKVTSYSSTTLVIDVTNTTTYLTPSCSSWEIVILPGSGLYGTDDCTPLSAAALAGASNGVTLFFPRDTGDYFTSCTIAFAPSQSRQNVLLNQFGVNYDNLYAPGVTFKISSPAKAKIIASSAAANPVVNFTYAANVPPGTGNNPSNWEMEIDGLGVDGRNLVGNCANFDSMREAHIHDASVSNCYEGLKFSGVYGGIRLYRNGFFGNTFGLTGPAQGDCIVEANSFWPYSALTGSSNVFAIFFPRMGGNCKISNNTFASNYAYPFSRQTAVYDIWVEGNASAPGETQRDFIVRGNEFMGPTAAFYCNGSSSTMNSFRIIVDANHNIPSDTGEFIGRFGDIHYCDDVTFSNNDVGMQENAISTSIAYTIYNSKRWAVTGGTIANNYATAILAQDSPDGFIGAGLRISDTGKFATATPIIDLVNADNTLINGVRAVQSDAAYGLTFVKCDAASTGVGSNGNLFTTPGVAVKYDCVSNTTVN